jgi:3-methyl-2-oxobutanoate hydroxymethyltransferase
LKKDPDFLINRKRTGTKIASLTAYDYPTAKLLDDCGLDFLLVGDSLGMVVLGHPDTTEVRMDAMLYHTAAVARGALGTSIVSDLPRLSYPTPEAAARNAGLLVAAGADAVKVEGGRECLPSIHAITASGIPLIGHLGMLPQRVREEGGYRIKGRTEAEAVALVEDALALEASGVKAIVLELVHPPLAAKITSTVAVPTVGIGSGPDCDGQILVLHDVIGLCPWFRPRFAKARADVAGEIARAAREFASETRGTAF